MVEFLNEDFRERYNETEPLFSMMLFQTCPHADGTMSNSAILFVLKIIIFL